MDFEHRRALVRWRRFRRPLESREHDVPASHLDSTANHADFGGNRTTDRRRIALGVLLAFSFVAVVLLAGSLWVGILFGVLMAFTMQPLHSRLAARVGGRRKLAALITALGTTLVASLLVAGVVYGATNELADAIVALQQRFAGAPLSEVVGERGHRLIERFGLSESELLQRIQAELGRAVGYLTAAAGLLLATTTSALISLLIGSITMYYALVDWSTISTSLERVLPFDPRHTRALVLEFRNVGRSALLGLVATAAAQAVLAAIGYAIFGVPRALSFGVLTGVSSFVPVLATATVWVPVAIYLLLQGSTLSGILLVVWCVVLITGFGEYVLRPRLMGGSGKGQPLLMLVGVLGGIQLFGLPGIVVGPVMMSLFVAIFRIYEREVDLVHAGAPERPSMPAQLPLPIDGMRPSETKGKSRAEGPRGSFDRIS
ncbi:MAG: AI-2E family transporter [Polyangiaceae bacterium]